MNHKEEFLEDLKKTSYLENISQQVKEETKISLADLENYFLSIRNEAFKKMDKEEHINEKFTNILNFNLGDSVFKGLIEGLNLTEEIEEREKHLKQIEADTSIEFEFKINGLLSQFFGHQVYKDLKKAVKEKLDFIFDNFELSEMDYDHVYETFEELLYSNELNVNEDENVSFIISTSTIDLHGKIVIHINNMWGNSEDEVYGEYFEINTYYDIKQTDNITRYQNEEDLQEIAECFGEDYNKLKKEFSPFFVVDDKEKDLEYSKQSEQVVEEVQS